MGFPVNVATIAQAQIDNKRGTYDPSDYVPRPALFGLMEAFFNARNWQPNFSWEKRPVYHDSKKVEDGDLVVLCGLRAPPVDPMLRMMNNWDKEPSFFEIREYNGSRYLIQQYGPDRQKARHFMVKKTPDNKLNLIDVDTKNALEWQGDWIGVDAYNESDPLARNIAFDKGGMYFEKSGKPAVYEEDRSNSYWANNDGRGQRACIWPVKVAWVETPLGSLG